MVPGVALDDEAGAAKTIEAVTRRIATKPAALTILRMRFSFAPRGGLLRKQSRVNHNYAHWLSVVPQLFLDCF
jgi:hypothetical protein